MNTALTALIQKDAIYGALGPYSISGCLDPGTHSFNPYNGIIVPFCDWHYAERLRGIPIPECYRNYP